MADRRIRTRVFAVAGLGWGLSLQFAPDAVADALCPELPPDRRWIARSLGARLIAQHATLLVAPHRPFTTASAVVEALHAASMLPLLSLPAYRRAALVSGGVAALSAVVLGTTARPQRH